MQGWIRLHRELIDKPIWKVSTPEQKSILITVLLLVNYTERKWEWKGSQYICKPGQVITSLEQLQAACGKGVTIQNLRTALTRFENIGFLTNESTKTGRLITICNWDDYQPEEEAANKASNSCLTDNQQTPNNQLTPNKKYKKDNNIRNIFIIPTLNEIENYCKERNNGIDPELFYDFYSSKGWMVGKDKMKDWKASVRTWEKNKEKSCTKKESYGKSESKLPTRITKCSFSESNSQ